MSLIQKLFSELENPALYGFVKSIHGHFYYTKTQNNLILPLLLPTRLQKENINVLVGDLVEIDFQNKNIKKVVSRLSELVRPKVANIDQALIVVSATNPEPEHLDRLLCHAGITLPEKPIICLTKIDLAPISAIFELYQSLGYTIITLNNTTGEGLENLIPLLENKMSVLAGASGVGKSSLLNSLSPNLRLKTGEVSHKSAKGTHTTRHTEIFEINKNQKTFYILDTPGFSRLNANCSMLEIAQSKAFPEIALATEKCKFIDCKHKFEEDCQIIFTQSRRSSYLKLLQEAEEWEKAQLESHKNKEEKTKTNFQTNIPLLTSSQRLVSRHTLKQAFEQTIEEDQDHFSRE